MPVSCQHEAMVAPAPTRALAQEASWARTTPPLFYFSVYVRTEDINRGQSSNMETAAVRLYFLLEHNYSLVILHIIWI